MSNVANGWVWLSFSVFLIIALSLDTIVLNNKISRPHESMRAALAWTLVWVVLAIIFNILLWFYLLETTTSAFAHKTALDFLTGYLIEKSLSVDNLFVFYIIFKQLRIPPANQGRVLAYGIWSAIVMRLVLILLGTWLVSQFHWVLYLMGAFLLFTGIKILLIKDKEKDISQSVIIKFIHRYFRVTTEMHGEAFFVRLGNLYYATPLLVTLVFIEISDLIFAVDSIPAIFAITTDPFIVWSSNIFAILGLRAMYFLLAGMINRFSLLKYGIALILVFVGAKMVLMPWYSIKGIVSLAVILSILVIFTLMSLIHTRSRGAS